MTWVVVWFTPDSILDIRPFALVANIIQSNSTHLGTVAMAVFWLYHMYRHPGLDPCVCAMVHASLEKRWKKQNCEVFLLALILNPLICDMCFAANSPFRHFVHVSNLLNSMYKHMWNTNQDPDFELQDTLHGYFFKLKEFGNEGMQLNYHQRKAAAQVSLYLIHKSLLLLIKSSETVCQSY